MPNIEERCDADCQPHTLRLSVVRGGGAGAVPPADGGAGGDPRRKRLRIPKRPDQRAARTDAPYGGLLNNIYDAAVVADGAGHILDVNERAVEFFEYDSGAFRHMGIPDIVAGADGALLRAIRDNTDRFALLEAHCVRRSREIFPAEIAVSRLSPAADTAYLFLIRNISVRRRAEEMLRTEHNALQNARSGIVITDRMAHIEYANPTFAAMLGVDGGEPLLRQDLRGVFENRAIMDEAVRQVVERNASWSGEVVAQDKRSGSRRVIEAAAAANRNREGQLAGIVFSFTDVTARTQAEEAMRRSNEELERRVAERTVELAATNRRLTEEMRMREEATAHQAALQFRLARAERMESLGVLAGGVAHDLNNILGPLVALPSLIVADLNTGCPRCAPQMERAAGDLRMIDESTKRAAATIRDLLTLGRRGNFEKQPLALNEVLTRYLATPEFKSLEEAAPGVALELDLDPAVAAVAGSESHLLRAVANVIRNAFEAQDGRGTVALRTRIVELAEPLLGHEVVPAGRYVLIRISDSGRGMSDADLQRVFEPFFTRKKSTGNSGSGLGLSIVHRAIKDHDGFIDVRSAVGTGTAFDLYLPAADGKAPAQASAAPVSVHSGTEHVLVADDVPAQRHLAERALSSLGYAVTCVASGAEAVRFFEKVRGGGRPACDLVLLDMVMDDGIDGLDTLKAVRALAPAQKAIVTSGHGMTPRAAEAGELGAGWLPKPYTIESLAAALRAALDG
jgi:PAS domain S-box-containing protein